MKVVRSSPVRTGRLYPQEYPGTHFFIFRGWVGCFGKKSTVTRTGIDPGTFRLIAQRLNHYATPGPPIKGRSWKIILKVRLFFNLDEDCISKASVLHFKYKEVKVLYYNLEIKVVNICTHIKASVLWLSTFWYLCIIFLFFKSTKLHKAIFCYITLSAS